MRGKTMPQRMNGSCFYYYQSSEYFVERVMPNDEHSIKLRVYDTKTKNAKAADQILNFIDVDFNFQKYNF